MAKADILSQIYASKKTDYDFNFNALVAPPLLSMLTVEDINYLDYLITSVKFASKLEYKYDEIRKVMNNRGFRKLHAGTNRVIYYNPDIPGIVLKVCTNTIALSDVFNEYRNQFHLAPFVQKVFEWSPKGTVGLFERVDPITSRQEFLSIADSVFELLNKKILGEFILEDIGSEYFMNWGIRRIGGNRGRAWGPVLLDFPMMFKLDGKKLFCNTIHPITGKRCTGVIDYDAGFNRLVCPVCGREYQARQLAKYEDDNSIIIANSKGEKKMEIIVKRGKDVVMECNDKATRTIQQKPKNNIEVSVDTTNKRPVVSNNKDSKEQDIILLKVLLSHYPEIGAELIQDRFYTLPKSNFENGGVERLIVNDIQYIRADLINHEHECHCGKNCHCHDDEESKENLVKPTEKDFDENGNLIIERSEEPIDARQDYIDDEEENVPLIDSNKASKF